MNLTNKNFATAYVWLCDNMGVVDQLDLSRKTGLAQNTISHILRGKCGVSLKTMRKFNEAFGNVFNMAFLRGESSVMLAADVKYDASDRETLDRVVTKLKVKFEDEVPTGCSEISVTPAEWYYGLNYVMGAPCDMKANQPRTVSVPESYVGTSGVVSVSIFGFSTDSEWATDVQVTSQNATGETLGTATIKDAPFKANRATEYSGCIFGSNGAVDVSLTDEWDDPVTGEW